MVRVASCHDMSCDDCDVVACMSSRCDVIFCVLS